MSKEPTREEIQDWLLPALNICRRIEIDVARHPDCPYKNLAKDGTTGLLKTLYWLNKGEKP